MNTYCVFQAPGQEPVKIRAESYISPIRNNPTMSVQFYVGKQVVADFAGVHGVCMESAYVKGQAPKKS